MSMGNGMDSTSRILRGERRSHDLGLRWARVGHPPSSPPPLANGARQMMVGPSRGAIRVGRPGIDATAVAWIARDRFVHSLEVPHILTDITDSARPTRRAPRRLRPAETTGVAGPTRHGSREEDDIPGLSDEITQHRTRHAVVVGLWKHPTDGIASG